MNKVICNSLQSFWDMAENHFLTDLDVHCVFPVSDSMKEMLDYYKERFKIRSISFSESVASLDTRLLSLQANTY